MRRGVSVSSLNHARRDPARFRARTPEAARMPTIEYEVLAKSTAGPTTADDEGDLLEEEALVEEISIDGMCGVY